MSESPCTGCRATNRGRLFFAYVNHYAGDELTKRRVRLCSDCVADVLGPLLEGADYWENGQWVLDWIPAKYASTATAPLVASSFSGDPRISTPISETQSSTTPSATHAGTASSSPAAQSSKPLQEVASSLAPKPLRRRSRRAAS